MAEVRDYAPTGFYKARRPFTMDGRDYNYEEPVDLKNVEPRRVRLMWEAKLIDHAPAPEASVPVPVPAPEPVKAPVTARKRAAKEAPPTVEEAAPAPPVASESPAGLRMVHKGFGKWDVVDILDAVIASDLAKPDAQKLVAGTL